jgi:Dihydrodipicolinate reductase
MRIGILGASGRIGTRLVELVLATPGLELAAAYVSANSRHLGRKVASSALEYRTPDPNMKAHCDVVIDFSSPAASLAFQELLGTSPLPMVIGTAGFGAAESEALSRFAAYRPLLVDANFAYGFEAFKQALLDFARHVPGAVPQIFETYHIRKKPEPSGTSRMLATELHAARSQAMGFDAGPTTIHVFREGDCVGTTEVRFDLGSAELVCTFAVQTTEAYAAGAIAAARWLVSEAPGPGRYSVADTLARTGGARRG